MNSREEAEHLLVLAKRHVGSLQETVHLQGFADEDWGFLAQQTIEKLLKALWVLGGVNPPRTHALDPLLDGVPAKSGTIAVPATLLDLEDFAVQARYDAEPLALPASRLQLLDELEQLLDQVQQQLESEFPFGS